MLPQKRKNEGDTDNELDQAVDESSIMVPKHSGVDLSEIKNQESDGSDVVMQD